MQTAFLSPRVFTISDFLTSSECQRLVALAESAGFIAAGVRTTEGQKSMPNIRNNERATVDNPEWVESIWKKMQGVALPMMDGAAAVGLPKDLRFYKYHPGQRFKMHKDGPWHERGMTSKLTFLVYLNDDFQGGATDFREFLVLPERGKALAFVHDTWHEGCTVEAGVKYVLRSDVLFDVAVGP